MDDMLILDKNEYMIKSTKKILTNKSDIKDLDFIDVILGINITRTSYGYMLSQSYYIEKNINNFLKGGNNTIKTPMDTCIYLSKHKCKETLQLEYS
jgi:hypothetical protein